MTTAHTPGPFSVHPYTSVHYPPRWIQPSGGKPGFTSASITIGAGERWIGEVTMQTPAPGYPHVEDQNELLANAALFIAAPDMLEALRHMLVAYAGVDGVHPHALNLCRAAIEKATTLPVVETEKAAA